MATKPEASADEETYEEAEEGQEAGQEEEEEVEYEEVEEAEEVEEVEEEEEEEEEEAGGVEVTESTQQDEAPSVEGEVPVEVAAVPAGATVAEAERSEATAVDSGATDGSPSPAAHGVKGGNEIDLKAIEAQATKVGMVCQSLCACICMAAQGHA